jgi:anion-transporting  ArsA/GET3 family ATPase
MARRGRFTGGAGIHRFFPMTTPRLIFVTGKGGTGKSTIAAALALALSRRRPTTLADLDRRLSAAAALGAIPKGEAPVAVSETLEVVALSPRAELETFIRRIVPVAAISRRMLRSTTFAYVTAALPGLEAFLMLERLRIMAGDAALFDRQVVIDAPASGTALELLAVAGGIGKLAPGGTLNRLARGVESFLRDPHLFGVMLTVTPEELALREAIETAAALHAQLGIVSLMAVLNRTPKSLFTRDDLDVLGALPAHRALAHRREAERRFAHHARRSLRAAGVEAIEIPMIYERAMGAAEIAALARELSPALRT